MITVSTGFFAFSLVPSSTSHLSIDTCYLPVEFSKNKNKKSIPLLIVFLQISPQWLQEQVQTPLAKPLKHYQNRDWLCVCCVLLLKRVRLFETPWTVAPQAPLSMEFSRQEYWSKLPFPILGDLPNPGIKPTSLASPALQVDSLPLSPLQSPLTTFMGLLWRLNEIIGTKIHCKQKGELYRCL